MATDVGICSSACIKLGVEPIASLSDNTRQALILNEQFAKIRDALTYEHPWNFAMKWIELTSGSTIHDNPEYDYRHALPGDCLRVWDTEYPDEDYEVLEGYIYSNSETLKIKYIKQVTDASKMSPAFAEALACRIAHDCCFALVQSNSFKATLMQEMEAYLPRVRTGDAQENRAKQLQQDIFLNARY
jgi:hypothetical protein